MNKFFFTLIIFSISSLVWGCAGHADNKSNNSADEQRARAEKAQGELSREVGK
jgi:hypothetical protein